MPMKRKPPMSPKQGSSKSPLKPAMGPGMKTNKGPGQGGMRPPLRPREY